MAKDNTGLILSALTLGVGFCILVSIWMKPTVVIVDQEMM